MTDTRNEAIEFAHKNAERYLEELIDYVRIPSVSTLPEHKPDMQVGAEWTRDKLTEIGMQNVAIMPTDGHPVVYADHLEAGDDAPTVIIYGHYDVQPVEPLDLWESDPFEAEVRDGKLFGRGASDMKGQIVASMKAVDAVMKHDGLNVNLKWLIEGEEEIGSPNLGKFITENKDLLSADTCLNTDGGILAEDTPSIIYGLRGLSYFEIHVEGPDHDLHSGVYGGAVLNPANELARLIGGMHDEDGRVTIPSFYDDIPEMDEEERAELAKLGMDDDFFLAQTGAPVLHGEKGYTPVEHANARPTLDVNGFYSGFIGDGSKTVLPSKAMAKVSTRLVPNQIPDKIYTGLKQYMEENARPGIKWEVLELVGNVPASITPRDSDSVQALAKGMESVWGKPALYMRMGGTVPVVFQMDNMLGIKTVMSGFGLPDDNLHAPNEKLTLSSWYKGIDSLIHFFYNLN